MNIKDADANPVRDVSADARRAAADGSKGGIFPLAPLREQDVPNAELREARELPHTACAISHRAWLHDAHSLDQIITYDTFNKAEAFLTSHG